MSYFQQIRKSGGSASLVKELSEKLTRFQAETGVEDIDNLRQMRVDTDSIAYTDTDNNIMDADISDTSSVAYTDTDTNSLYTGAFKWYFDSNNKPTNPIIWPFFVWRFKTN